MSESTVRKIKTKANLWNALQDALDHEGDNAPFSLDFSDAQWAKLKIVYSGAGFDRSLTPSAMHGIVELQSSLYRSAATILRNKADGRSLTDAEKQSLELSFTISEGSADAESDGKKFMTKLAEGVSKMDSKHTLIALLVLGTMYFGVEGFKIYVEDAGKTAERQQLADLSSKIMDHDEKGMKLLSESFKASTKASEVKEQAVVGFGGVVTSSGSANSITVQGTKLNNEQISQAKHNPRRSFKKFQVREEFQIKGVDPTSPNGFSVKIKSVVSGLEYWASLLDTLSSDRDRAAIRKAEWKKQPVILTVTGRILRNEVRDARILTSANKAIPLGSTAPKIKYAKA